MRRQLPGGLSVGEGLAHRSEQLCDRRPRGWGQGVKHVLRSEAGGAGTLLLVAANDLAAVGVLEDEGAAKVDAEVSTSAGEVEAEDDEGKEEEEEDDEGKEEQEQDDEGKEEEDEGAKVFAVLDSLLK